MSREYIPIASEPVDIRTRVLTFAAGGYTNAIAGDVGKAVVGGVTGDSGVLVSYDNTARTWVVTADAPADLFDQAEAITITAGTGAGTTAGASATGHTFARKVHGIRSNIAGTFYATLRGEGSISETSVPYTVLAGDIVEGHFVSVDVGSDADFHAVDVLLGQTLPRDQ